MSSSILATLDIEDMSPKQLRKILNGIARSQQPFGKKTKEEQDKDRDEAEDENDSVVDLHREKSGDSKPPKVLKDDMKIADKKKDGSADEEDEDEKDEEKTDA